MKLTTRILLSNPKTSNPIIPIRITQKSVKIRKTLIKATYPQKQQLSSNQRTTKKPLATQYGRNRWTMKKRSQIDWNTWEIVKTPPGVNIVGSK
jgi:hypothetical protein